MDFIAFNQLFRYGSYLDTCHFIKCLFNDILHLYRIRSLCISFHSFAPLILTALSPRLSMAGGLSSPFDVRHSGHEFYGNISQIFLDIYLFVHRLQMAISCHKRADLLLWIFKNQISFHYHITLASLLSETYPVFVQLPVYANPSCDLITCHKTKSARLITPFISGIVKLDM